MELPVLFVRVQMDCRSNTSYVYIYWYTIAQVRNEILIFQACFKILCEQTSRLV